MARKTIVMLEDDIDGGSADETLQFAFDGKSYAIDLSTTNADRFRKAIGPFLVGARREGSTTKPRGRAEPNEYPDIDPAAVRAWAKANGYEVNVRGRVAYNIIEAFKAAGY
jgi:hypothetical protein